MAIDNIRENNDLTPADIPWIRRGVNELVEAHTKLEENKALFAVWFNLDDELNVNLFEILDCWPDDPWGKNLITTLEFNGSRDIPLPPGGKIVLYVASPSQALVAVQKDHDVIKALRDSKKADDFKVLKPADDEDVRKFWDSL